MRPLETEHYLTNRSAGLPSYLHSQPLAIATTQEDMQKAIKAAKKKIARDVLNNAHSASNSPSGSDAGNLPPPGLPSQSVQITTTVGHQSSVQIVPLKRIHPAIGDEVGTTGLPPDSIAPPSDSSNTMTVSATQEDFEEDFVLPGDESEDETTPSGDMHSQEPRFSKKGAKWRREKLRTRSHCVLLKLYALEEGLADRARKCSTCLGIKETYQYRQCQHAGTEGNVTALEYDRLPSERSLTHLYQKCYSQFLSCTREWKVIKTLMRANSKTGTDLKAGEATVKCGFCPIPGVNIPEDWKSDPDA
ncbi:hypothetical protein FRC04_007386 [Tulasnella sp. 424]|nr:hypothetical protein FRC04_007386 [Tulasnella sp. 424]